MPQGFPISAPSKAGETPLAAFDEQDSAFASAFAILRGAIREHAFPCATVAVTHHGSLVASKAFGKLTYDSASPEPAPTTIFDLASVSKAVATTTAAMILYERGLLDLETPVIAIAPEFVGADFRRNEVTMRMLLTHTSGLPAHAKLFQQASNPNDLLSLAFACELEATPGTHTEYSDLGFIILGALLERIADEALDDFCQREIFGKLGMAQTMFIPPAALRRSIPPTADDRTFRRRIIQGEVQDENASVLGGVAGHAGLFSSAADLVVFANVMLQEGRPLVRRETVKLFLQRAVSPQGASRALGWDAPSVLSQSGKYFSAHSFGHLGYTGTSLWIDPVRQLAIVLLTNRTWPDCNNQAIKNVRPAFHDAVIEALALEAIA